MRVVVAEKPSVARDLARVLGASQRHEGWIGGPDLAVTWCVGHLVELADPAAYEPAWKTWRLELLPMVPDRFLLRPRKEGNDQLAVVKRLLGSREVRDVVNACDAGREGELIFRYVADLVGLKRPVLRFWVSSMTDEAIREGWRRLAPAARYDALGDAARCRSEADWLVGMNVTRAMTCRTREVGGDALWSVGRVQTPTLAMIVRRDAEIAAFVPETYWTVSAELVVQRPEGLARWTARYFDARHAEEPAPRPGEARPEEADEASHAERLPSAELADAVVQAITGAQGRVTAAKRKERREAPPLLYDLTALQRRASQRYGMSAQATLDTAQALYEHHKLITYPRTDARYLTSDQAGELPGVLAALAALPVYAPFADALRGAPLRLGRRIINDDEVGDHHAILPTHRSAANVRLTVEEKRVYDLVARRFMAALSPDAIIDAAEIIVAVPAAGLPSPLSSPVHLRARGRVVREAGWRAVDPPGASRDVQLPLVEVDDPARVEEAASREAQTRPPRPHDDASLLLAMETAGKGLDDAELARALRSGGLGTPATRAAILQTLVDRGYVVRDGRTLRATPRGVALIDVLPVEELKSAELTGRWEKRLADMAEGRDARDAFMRDVVDHVRGVVDAIRGAALAPVMAEVSPSSVVGKCPRCGGEVVARGAVYRCAAGCGLALWGKVAKKALSEATIKLLLSGRRTRPLKGFQSKAGKPFEAMLELDEDFKIRFVFEPRGEPGADAAAPRPEPAPKRPRAPSAVAGRGEAPAEGRTRARAAGGASGGRGAGRARAGGERAPASSAPVTAMPAAAATPVGAPCPACGAGRVIAGRAAWGCDRWSSGCAWRLPFRRDDGTLRSEADAAREIGQRGRGRADR